MNPPALTGFVKVRDSYGAADQQRAHPLFFDLLEAAPDAMVIIGPDGRHPRQRPNRPDVRVSARGAGSEIEILVPALPGQVH